MDVSMRLNLKMAVLKAARTQVKFACWCGKSPVWISNIITGRTTPTDESKRLICGQLGIKVDSSAAEKLFKET